LPLQSWAADAIGDATPVADPVPIYDTEMRGSADVYASGFYVRGAAGWIHPVMKGIDYRVPGAWKVFDTYDLDDSWAVEGAIGYQINRYLRTELSLNYMGTADFNGSTSGSCGVAINCVSSDSATWSAYTLMASAYVDFDFWGASSVGIIPYVGGGVGGSYVSYGDLQNQSCEVGNSFNCDPTFVHGGKKNWRFTYQLTAGLAYQFRCDLTGDAYYRYQHINGGEMFGYQAGGGPGYDQGIDVHSVMAGLRFYPGRDCSPEPYVQPEPLVYK
jgi:opacity protein-like surface antigen